MTSSNGSWTDIHDFGAIVNQINLLKQRLDETHKQIIGLERSVDRRLNTIEQRMDKFESTRTRERQTERLDLPCFELDGREKRLRETYSAIRTGKTVPFDSQIGRM